MFLATAALIFGTVSAHRLGGTQCDTQIAMVRNQHPSTVDSFTVGHCRSLGGTCCADKHGRNGYAFDLQDGEFDFFNCQYCFSSSRDDEGFTESSS